MTLNSGSRATEGLVRVRLWRAEETRWVGSLTKCLADMTILTETNGQPDYREARILYVVSQIMLFSLVLDFF